MASKDRRKEAALKRSHMRADGRNRANAPKDPISQFVANTVTGPWLSELTYQSERAARTRRDNPNIGSAAKNNKKK